MTTYLVRCTTETGEREPHRAFVAVSPRDAVRMAVDKRKPGLQPTTPAFMGRTVDAEDYWCRFDHYRVRRVDGGPIR